MAVRWRGQWAHLLLADKAALDAGDVPVVQEAHDVDLVLTRPLGPPHLGDLLQRIPVTGGKGL